MTSRKRLADINPQADTIELGGVLIKLSPPNLNVLAMLEERFNLPFAELTSVLEPNSSMFVRNLRFVLFAMISQDRPDATELWVGQNITTLNMQEVCTKVMTAFM
jgi:hypothetical protein